LPSIEIVELQGASLELRRDDEVKKREQGSRRRFWERSERLPALSELRVPFTIARARLTGGEIRVRGPAGEERAAIAVTSLEIDDLVPGKTANVRLAGTLSIADGDIDAEAGGVELTGVTGQREDGVLIGWKGSAKTKLTAKGGEPLSVFVSFDSFRRGSAMDASFTLDGRLGPRRVGTARVTWHEQPPEAGAPRSLAIDVKVDELREEVVAPISAVVGRRRLGISKLDGSGHIALAEGAEPSFDVEAEASVGGGTLRARIATPKAGEERSGAVLDVTARRVDLAKVVPLIDPSDRHRVRGIIDLTAHASARGADMAALAAAAAGALEAHVERGRIVGIPTLDFLAEHTGVDEVRELSDATLDAKIRLDAGVARIERMEVDSATVRLFVTGSARTSGDLDLRVVPRLGPNLFGRMKDVPVAGKIAAGADGLLELPVEVQVTGTFSDPRQAMVPHAPGAAEPAGKAIADAFEAGKRGAAGVFDRLLGR
jgi:hypothetical protein